MGGLHAFQFQQCLAHRAGAPASGHPADSQLGSRGRGRNCWCWPRLARRGDRRFPLLQDDPIGGEWANQGSHCFQQLIFGRALAPSGDLLHLEGLAALADLEEQLSVALRQAPAQLQSYFGDRFEPDFLLQRSEERRVGKECRL